MADGFYQGQSLRGFVEPSGRKRKPYRGVVQVEFITWKPVLAHEFKTETDAETWVQQTIDRLSSAPDRKYIEP